MLLELKEIKAGYQKKNVLFGLTMGVHQKELVALVGPNGAGKTTTLRTIFGYIHPIEGTILFQGHDIKHNTPFQNVKNGISLVPQGGKVFKTLTVLENLEMGGYLLKQKGEVLRSLQQVYEMFPILDERKFQLARTLSGGEQQMLAIGRGLMFTPKLLLLDEPSMGLAPLVLRSLMGTISKVKEQIESSVIIVEQNVNEVLKIANRVYVMKLGKIVFHEEYPENLLREEKLRKAYLS
jgi:branched-chain amino acid transport system ATP-binding protein